VVEGRATGQADLLRRQLPWRISRQPQRWHGFPDDRGEQQTALRRLCYSKESDVTN